MTKLEYGCFLGACLAYLAHRQRDRVGIMTFDSDIVTHVPPSAKHFDQVLHTLDRAKAERPGHLSAPLNKMAEHFKRRGILLLISDFYDEPDAILEAIKPLRFLGNDLIVFHVLDPQESTSSSTTPRASRTSRTRDQVPVVPQSFREQYRSLIQRAHQRADHQVLRAAHRLRAAEHLGAARSRVVQLSVEPGETGEGAVKVSSPVIP